MKKEMRKVSARMMAFLLVLCMCAPLVFATKSEAAKGYYFSYGGVSVTMGSKAKKFIKAAGKKQSYKKKKSCAFKGYDRTRQYADFILSTYSNSKKGAEYVNGITFRTSSVKTKEGIGIGSSESDVISAYGSKDPVSIGGRKFFTYVKGKTKLIIVTENSKVTMLRYNLK